MCSRNLLIEVKATSPEHGEETQTFVVQTGTEFLVKPDFKVVSIMVIEVPDAN